MPTLSEMSAQNELARTQEIVGNLDTGQCSLVHWIFGAKPQSAPSLYRNYVVPYVSVAALTYGVLLLIASLTLPTLLVRSSELKLPFLRDYNTAWLFLVSLPFMIVLQVTERRVIPASIKKLFEEVVFSVRGRTARDFVKRWQERFKRRNLYGQLLGVGAGLVAAIGNYSNSTQPGYGTAFATNDHLNALGWCFLVFIFVFFFVALHYVVRAITIAGLLRDMVKLEDSRINIIPFHPDKCGGLGSIGSIALRHQYLLSVLGINIIILLWQSQTLAPGLVMGYLVAAAIVIYLAMGPIGFMGPLLPFRAAMANEKARLSGLVSKRISVQLSKVLDETENVGISRQDEEQIVRLQRLAELIGRLPVWPFDATTLKRFFTSYVFPIVALLLSWIYNTYGSSIFD